jgi:hypothetical protein
MTDKIKLTLDYSKWICGEGGQYQVGKGESALLNKDGFMCCLGQWAVQLGVPQGAMLGIGEPESLNGAVPGLSYPYEYDEDTRSNRNTTFSGEAIGINDNKKTTPDEKIDLLGELCEKNGFELEVINRPIKPPHTNR